MDRDARKAMSDSVALRLADLGAVEVKSMFGGHGLRLDAITFAMITSDGSFYWRTDAESEPDWIAAGGEKFLYTRKNTGVKSSMPYHKLRAIPEDQGELLAWARKALDAARRAKK